MLFGTFFKHWVLKIWNKYIMKYPPGPIGYPLFGSSSKFGMTPFKFLID